MTEELNIDQDKQIDPDALDVEWLNQSNLFYKYSNALNEAIDRKNDMKLQVEAAKEEVDRVKAELDLAIREDPDEYGLSKVTESAITSTILTQPELQAAQKKYYSAKEALNAAQSEVNKLFTDVNTMETKKDSLEQLVKLLNQQYFSTPVEPRDLSMEYHKKIAKNKKGAKEKVKKRRSKRDE